MRSLGYMMFFCLILGCKDFIEPSIAQRKMVLLAPGDSTKTNVYRQTFWWERLDDALYYRLQVATPDFEKPNQLLLDTLVKQDKFIFSLDPGNYQWRVRGENGSTKSLFTTRVLTVFPSSLANQTVLPANPANMFTTANPEIRFQWTALYGATQYRLQLDRNHFLDEKNLTLDVLTDQTAYVSTLPQEGTYEFRVRAENTSELSKWSSTRSVMYDVTPPARVSLISPTNQQTVSKPVKFTWSTVSDAEKYEFILLKSDRVTLYNGSFPQLTATNTITLSLGDSGETLAWKVRAVDKAGNKGEFSEINTVTIQ